jgi:uncharacterized protein
MIEPRSPHFEILPLGAVRPIGWMKAQLWRDLTEGFAGCLDQLTERAATDLFTHRIASSSQQFAWWDSETRGNWLWGYTLMSFLANAPEHQARATALLEKLKSTQDADGYLGIYTPASRYAHGERENGELWAQSRALLALLTYYEFTGDVTYLDAVRRAVDLTLRHYTPDRSYFRAASANDRDASTGLTHGLCYVDVVEWLYALTGVTRYRDFGVWLYEDFSRMPLPFPSDDLSLTNALDRHKPLHGHAVHTAEQLRVLLWADRMGGDPQVKIAAQNALWKLRRYALLSGAVIGDESVHGLPTPDMGYEYCTLTELLFSLTSALQKNGDSTLGDWIETLAFNAGQGARFADGSGVSYLTTDSRFAATADRADSYSWLSGQHGRFKYSPTHEDVACCCNPNAVRFLPHTITRMWLRASDGLAAVIYGPCQLTIKVNGVRVSITEETSYPFSDVVRFTITPEYSVTFALYLRKPAWASSVEVNGAAAQDIEGYLVVDKTWSAEETIEVRFKAVVQVIPYPTGEYAVRRGPLHYVLPIEHVRQPIKDYALDHFHDYNVLPRDIEQAYERVVLDRSQPDYGLTFEADPAIDVNHCWEQSPVRLKFGATALVPLGCTILRRASFPLK